SGGARRAGLPDGISWRYVIAGRVAGIRKEKNSLMIYIGTDEGIYRWFRGAPWPIYHSLQDRVVVSLASPGLGLLIAVDGSGGVLESANNGMDWREIPVPEGIGRPVAVALGTAPGSVLLTTKPLGLFRRVVGAPIPSPSEEADGGAPAFVRNLLARARRRGSSATALAPPPPRGPAA